MPPVKMRGDGRMAKKPKQTLSRLLSYMLKYKETLMVFCDISTPQAAPSKKAAKALDNPTLHALEQAVPLEEPEPVFTIYEDIRQKLIAQGMPAEQIAFIHEANTEVR